MTSAMALKSLPYLRTPGTPKYFHELLSMHLSNFVSFRTLDSDEQFLVCPTSVDSAGIIRSLPVGQSFSNPFFQDAENLFVFLDEAFKGDYFSVHSFEDGVALAAHFRFVTGECDQVIVIQVHATRWFPLRMATGRQRGSTGTDTTSSPYIGAYSALLVPTDRARRRAHRSRTPAYANFIRMDSQVEE
jgi:hypothetical protein